MPKIQTGLYRTASGGAAQVHKVGRDEGSSRILAFGLLCPKKGKALEDSWDAATGAHLSKPEHNLTERVPTIGDHRHA